MPVMTQRLHRRSERGYALLLVLWVLAVMSAFAITVAKMANSNVKATEYLLEEMSSQNQLRSGFNFMVAHLQGPPGLGSESKYRAIRGEDLGWWLVQMAPWRAEKLAVDPGQSLADLPEVAGAYYCEIRAEDAKLPLQRLDKEILENLQTLSHSQVEQLAATIKLKTLKKEPLSLYELAADSALDTKTLFGDKDTFGLAEVVTPFSSGKVYLNGASQEILALLPQVGDVVAREIVERIAYGHPFEKVDDLHQVLGVTPKMYKSLKDWVTVKPEYYQLKIVNAEGTQRGEIEGIVRVGAEAPEVVFIKEG